MVMAGVGLLLVFFIGWFLVSRISSSAAQQISDLTGNDHLTGLPNRQTFSDAFDKKLKLCKLDGRSLVYLLIDIDNFSNIVNVFGYEGSDDMLRHIARRLCVAAGEEALVCRIDGDTFGILAELKEADGAARLGEKLLQVMRRPVTWKNKSLRPLSSIGAVVFPDDGMTRANLEHRAGLVRWTASKNGGDNLCFYDPHLEEKYEDMCKLEHLIKKAVREENFQVYYQPLVNLTDETLYGFEALVRMPDGNGGHIMPGRFIPLAERLELLDKIGAFVLRQSCKAAADWPEHLHIAVNISPRHFQSEGFLKLVCNTLKETGLNPKRLEIEVTEDLMINDCALVHKHFRELQKVGIGVVLDDFGTGYSSLNYLWRYSFSKLKIDRSFISAMETSESARSILRAMVVMARVLHIPVTAEGVENPSQAIWLRKLKCTIAQGFLYGRPKPATELAALILADWRKRAMQDIPGKMPTDDVINA
jgi:diguanylate cyclase (GGDEF)-like protein